MLKSKGMNLKGYKKQNEKCKTQRAKCRVYDAIIKIPPFKIEWWYKFYSVRNASTGSFFAAILEGIRPAIRVSETLIITSTIAATGGSAAAAGI